MAGWSVQGRGAEVTVMSFEGDVYAFRIASVTDLHLELATAPLWHDGRRPGDADELIGEALGEASRWTDDTFGGLEL